MRGAKKKDSREQSAEKSRKTGAELELEQVLPPSMQLSGRESQEQRSIGTSFAPLQTMMNDGKIGVE